MGTRGQESQNRPRQSGCVAAGAAALDSVPPCWPLTVSVEVAAAARWNGCTHAAAAAAAESTQRSCSNVAASWMEPVVVAVAAAADGANSSRLTKKERRTMGHTEIREAERRGGNDTNNIRSSHAVHLSSTVYVFVPLSSVACIMSVVCCVYVAVSLSLSLSRNRIESNRIPQWNNLYSTMHVYQRHHTQSTGTQQENDTTNNEEGTTHDKRGHNNINKARSRRRLWMYDMLACFLAIGRLSRLSTRIASHTIQINLVSVPNGSEKIIQG